MDTVQHTAKILVVDDEPKVAAIMERMTRHLGYEPAVASGAEEALRRFAEEPFDVVLTDVRLGTIDGLALLRSLRERDTSVPVVLVTGYASIPSAMEAIQSGAFDYISKPLTLEALQRVMTRAVEQRALSRRAPERAAEEVVELPNIVGASAAMLEVFKTVARVAPRFSSVLLLGESGTGKELVAKSLHEQSPRAANRFVPVNVAAIAEGLLESELFGHVRGAFTGATGTRRGLFEEAHLGTLFLDEIGELPAALQVKLLRALQEHRIKPVGGNEEIEVDVRLIAATNRDLEKMIRAGKFREDLFYRLNVITISLPPLRERKEDIPSLVEHFRQKLERESGHVSPRFAPAALARLAEYDWPGNVRELENVVARAVMMSPLDVIGSESLQSLGRTADAESSARDEFPKLASVVADYVRRVLEHTGGNRTRAAQILGISRRTIHRMSARRARPSESR